MKRIMTSFLALSLAACTSGGALPDETAMPLPPEANGGAASGTWLAGADPVSTDVTVAGESGTLAGTWLNVGEGSPAVLIIPGSGPTDRNGDNPMGAAGSVYKQLAEGLAAQGISSLRTDKRGIAASKDAGGKQEDMRIGYYVDDVEDWADLLKANGHHCVWLVGHSEGGLISLLSAQKLDLCGVVLLASVGRPVADTLRDQLRPKLPAAMMEAADAAIVKLENGERVDMADIPAPLTPLFNPSIQPYLADMMRYDPAVLAGKVEQPLLIIQLSEDMQVTKADGDALAKGAPQATYVEIDGVNHVLKPVPAGDLAANAKSYLDADLKIDPRVVETIVDFINRPGR